MPLVQDYAYLSLEPIQIEIPLRGALSAENIRVNVPSVFTVAIDTKPEVMQNAAVRLLGLSVGEIRKQAEEIIFGQLRQVIASMHIEEINRDREKFLQHIMASLEPELNKIGLQLINVNITDITDESGYIDAIGQKAASEAIQKARGDVADNLRMGETRVAAAERDKSIQVAEAQKEQAIGTRSAERDQAVQIAALEKQQVVGEKQAAFERESQVKHAEQQMRIQVADADAAAIAGENTAQAKVAGSQAELLVKKAEAYQLGESRKREAEAAVLEVQNRAMAKAALAEAERVEAEQRAKLEAPAKAQKAKVIVDAEAAADMRRLQARAEADAIFMKLDAEARGQLRDPGQEGRGLAADRGSLRRRQGSLPAADAGAHGQAGRSLQPGDLEHQVRQDRGLGRRRPRRPARHRRLPQRSVQDPAADDAGDEGHRRRRAARIAGQVQRRGACGRRGTGRWPRPCRWRKTNA